MAPVYNPAIRTNTLKYLLISRRCIPIIKTEQINILRQQYDAFLEEDKKRKERNECILEKLDKIRLSNTVTRYKSNVYSDPRVSFNCSGEEPIAYTHPQTNNITKQAASVNSIRKYKEAVIPTEIDVLAKPLDETYLINEISKKYILIPKLRSIVSDDYCPRAIKQDNNNENDWKSKYSILDKLKQNEKEDTIGYSNLNYRDENFLDDVPNKEPKHRFDDEAPTISTNRDAAKIKDDMYRNPYAPKPQTNMAYLEDEGETKLNNPTVRAKEEETIDTKKQSDINSESRPHVRREFKSDVDNINMNRDNNLNDAMGEQYQLQSDRRPVASEMTARDVHVNESAQFTNIGDQNEPTYNDKHENEATEKISHIVDDIRHVEVIDAMKPAVQEPSNKNPNISASETLEYPIDIINVEDFTPAENVTLVDGVNINPEGHAGNQAYLAQNDQYTSEPTAVAEQAYRSGDQLRGADQYVSDPRASAELAYLPGANMSSGGDQHISDPASAEQVYLPGTDHVPDGSQYVSEPTASAEQAYVLEDNTQSQRRDEHVSEPVAVDTEQIANVNENIEQHVINDSSNDPTMADTVTSEIAAFEAEQNEMFYSEQTNYQDYNQDAVGNAYNPQNAGYDPSLYYQQQQEAYPVEINEHEETSQRYDPNYEQQYAGQGAEQEQYVEQQQYAEQQYGQQQQYAEGQQYTEQPQYAEQQYGEQMQNQLDVNSTAHGYDQGLSEAMLEQQIMEQVEQELSNEGLDIPDQSVNDILDESAMYEVQTPVDAGANEPYVDNQEISQNLA